MAEPPSVGEVFEGGAALLEVRLRVAAGGLDVGVPQDVGDQDQVLRLIAHEAGGDGVAQRVRGLLDGRSGRHRGDDLADRAHRQVSTRWGEERVEFVAGDEVLDELERPAPVGRARPRRQRLPPEPGVVGIDHFSGRRHPRILSEPPDGQLRPTGIALSAAHEGRAAAKGAFSEPDPPLVSNADDFVAKAVLLRRPAGFAFKYRTNPRIGRFQVPAGSLDPRRHPAR